jgi:hypothetical protein
MDDAPSGVRPDFCSQKGITVVPEMVSLKTLAKRFDAHRYSVQRWLTEAGIHPLALGTGKKGAIRYDLAEVEAWLRSRLRISYRK